MNTISYIALIYYTSGRNGPRDSCFEEEEEEDDDDDDDDDDLNNNLPFFKESVLRICLAKAESEH
jgi:hypothetical protein